MANKLSKKVLTLERPALGSYEPLLAPKPAPDSFSHPNDPVKELALDTVTEFTTNNGVTVDGVLLKNGSVTGINLTATTAVITDLINEQTLAAGVTVDGVLLKDGTVKASSILSSAGTLVSGFYPLTAQDNITAGTGGAIVVTNYLTTINTDAGGDTFTLANGVQIGQLKKILLVVDGGGNAVITPTSLSGGTTITMNDANDFVILIWNGTAWVCIENSGSTIA